MLKTLDVNISSLCSTIWVPLFLVWGTHSLALEQAFEDYHGAQHCRCIEAIYHCDTNQNPPFPTRQQDQKVARSKVPIHQVPLDCQQDTSFMKAAHQSDLNLCRDLWRACANWPWVGPGARCNFLHCLAQINAPHILRQYLTSFTVAKPPEDFDESPEYAPRMDREWRELIRHEEEKWRRQAKSAELNELNDAYLTPLEVALRVGSFEAAQVLIEHGPQPTTNVMRSLYFGYLSSMDYPERHQEFFNFLQFLRAQNIFPALLNNLADQLLTLGATNGNMDTINFLETQGLIDFGKDMGTFPLSIAIALTNKHFAVAATLINLTSRQWERTPHYPLLIRLLHILDDSTQMAWVTTPTFSFSHEDDYGNTLLHYLVILEDLDDVFSKILNHHCARDIGRNKRQNSLLHLALMNGRNKKFSILLAWILQDRSAVTTDNLIPMLTDKNDQGQTPIDLLVTEKNKNLLPTLLQYSQQSHQFCLALQHALSSSTTFQDATLLRATHELGMATRKLFWVFKEQIRQQLEQNP